MVPSTKFLSFQEVLKSTMQDKNSVIYRQYIIHKIREGWQDIAGKLAEHSSPGKIDKSRLIVTADSAPLANQLFMIKRELLKKVNGINIRSLKNKEKAVVINALREKYKLAKLLISLKMAKSSYEYQVKALKYDKYKDLRQDIRIIFEESYNAYGSERIYGELKKQGKLY